MSDGATIPSPPVSLPVVAHLHHQFFLPSETFIHHTITAHSRFRPILLAREFSNLDAFPFPAGACFALSSPRYAAAWWPEAAARRLLHREIRGERVLRRCRARLIHAHFGPSGVLALPLARQTHLPLVTTFYGNDLSLPARDPGWRERYRELFAAGRLFLAEGPHMRAQLVELGCPPEKTAIQRIAVPLDRLPFRPRRQKKPGDRVVILFSGRLVEKKGLPVALQALRIARDVRQDFEFRVVGDGPQRAEVERIVRQLGMEGYVRLLGFLDYRSYLQEMEGADLLMQPSVTAADGDSEGGAPTTILEAQALGLPVLASRHADIPHVTAPGRSAWLCEEGDAGGLAAGLLHLLAEPGSWAAMGEAGRRHVEKNHDTRREIRGLEERYAGLIETDGR